MEINRRKFLQSGGLGAAGIAAGSILTRSAAGAERPNLLLIIVDQMRQPRWFPADAPLPAYDRLRREGLSFSNHFVSCVPCSPSRATLFTGLHMPQHGVEINVPSSPLVMGRYSFGPELSPEIPTLGHVFQKAGYRTPYLGKWHVSYTEDIEKPGLVRHGFEDWQGPDRHGGAKEGLRYDSTYADQAVAWLEKNGGKGPWFLTCSLINPHDACYFPIHAVPAIKVPDVCGQIPDNFHDALKGKPGIQRRWRSLWGRLYGTEIMTERKCRHYLDFYYYLQLKVDEQINKVLDTLDRLSLSGNTLVVFFSDHGDMVGSHRLMSKGPYVYHENNNVPLIFRWPGRVAAGAEAAALAQSVDVFPTLVELMGINHDCGRLPGKSLVPAINRPDAVGVNGLNDHVLMAWGQGREVYNRLGRKYLQPEVMAPSQIRAIFDGRYKFARYFDPGRPTEYELYDLGNDPLELRNLAGDPGAAALQKKMADRLAEAELEEMSPRP